MTITPNKLETRRNTNTLPVPETEQQFHWRDCWYPIVFMQDLPKNRPYSFSLYDEPLVLFRNQDGRLGCLSDRCPHRAAKLSDGQIIDGKIECLYHGWQFGTNGECLHIPQLPAQAKIPSNSCVKSFQVIERQGIVWLWAGESEKADQNSIPILADLDKPGFAHSDKISELPYDQSYFIENVLDPAHLHFSHDGSQGNREKAQPLEMEIIESSIKGFQGRFRDTKGSHQFWRNMDFWAPNLVSFRFSLEQKGWDFGLALYSMPLGKGKCRVLTRSYRNFFTWKVKLTPRWLIHLGQNKILEEDMPLVIGQKEQIERLGQSLKDLYLPLNTSDIFVIEYRKWLDKFGYFLPFYQGYSTSHNVETDNFSHHDVPLDRYKQHTQLCSSCNRAHKVINRVKHILVGVAIIMAAFAIVIDNYEMKIVAVSAAIMAVVLAAIAHKLKTHFERSYNRS
ncbi:MAG: Rieske 2Fe-2S domain-containing protein [Moorea sp. SIO2B7]|nr:Rieske 2Fe-2S domain-containing protein [Moorena sp. SIO2B7]